MKPERIWAYLLAVIAAGHIFGSMLRMEPVMSANDGARWDSVWSLTHGRGYAIVKPPDRPVYPYDTVDLVYRDGHFYMWKPALMPTVVAGLAWIPKALFGLAIPQDAKVVIRGILLLINILPLFFLVILYDRLLERRSCGPGARMFCVAAAAMGTYMTAYSVTLNNHTIAAWSAFFSLYSLIRIKYDGRREWWRFALCGLFAGWTACNEIVAALFVALVFLWLLKDHPRKTLAFFLPPIIALALAFMWTHYLSTGTFDLRYLHYRFGDPSRFQWPGSHWIDPRGVDAASDPKPLYLFHFTFGHHGIFSLTPVFVFGIYGMVSRGGMRAVNAIGLILTAALLAFYVATTHNYGGGAHGARWFIWLTPFWLIGMAPVIDRWFERSLAFRIVAIAALLVSMASVGFALSSRGVTGFMGPWGANWM